MHPIERLRYVARASGVPPTALVAETANALWTFADDPQALLVACRQMIGRQPTSGPLLWMAARLLCASNVAEEINRVVGEVEGDRPAPALSYALPDDATVCVLGWPQTVCDALVARGDIEALVVDTMGEASGLVRRLEQSDVAAYDVPQSGLGAAAAEADLVLIEPSAIGPKACLAVAGSRAAAATARAAGRDVWAVSGVGRLLPERMWDGLEQRALAEVEHWDADDEVVPLSLVTHVVDAAGPMPVADALARTDCPVVPELFGSFPQAG